MDWGRGGGHLTIIVGTGDGAFANKNCPQGRAFEQYFQTPGGCPRLELTRTLRLVVNAKHVCKSACAK